MRKLRPLVMALLLTAQWAVGCATQAPPSVVLPAVAGAEALLRPSAMNWGSQSVGGPTQRALWAEQLAGARKARRLLANLSEVDTRGVAGYGTSAATGAIASDPSYSYVNGTAYWLTTDGWVLKRTAAGGASAFRVGGGAHSFHESAVVVSFDGKRLYLHSDQGSFFAVNATDGSNLTGSPVVLGGADAAVGTGTPPFIDPLASLPNGREETIYVASHTGTLHRLVYHANGGDPNAITHVQSHALGLTNTAPYNERIRSGPIVYRGRAFVGVWRRHNTTSALDQGAFVDYQSNGGPFYTTTVGSLNRRVNVADAVWASPTIETDNALNPTLAFVPAGAAVAMFDLSTGEVARSLPLVLDHTVPTSGSLAGYPYSPTGISTVVVTPAVNASLSLRSDGSMDTANIHGAATVNQSGDNRSVYGLMRFPVTTATVTVAGVLKTIIDANLSLRVNAAPLVPLGGSIATRVFKCEPTTGDLLFPPAFTSGNLNALNRPRYFGSLTTLSHNAGDWAANAGVEATPNTDNVFTNNTDTVVSCRGLVGAPNQDYAFAEMHADPQSTFLSALLGGRTAPRFAAAGATPPRLSLTLSETGFVNPTSANRLVVGLNGRLMAVFCNALWTLDFSGNAANPTFAQRAGTFCEDSRTRFTLTRGGRNADALGTGPRDMSGATPFYVENRCPPLVEPLSATSCYAYVLDHHPVAQRVSLNRFMITDPNAPAALDHSLLLSNAGGDAQYGCQMMSYNPFNGQLFLGLGNAAGTQGRIWVHQRY